MLLGGRPLASYPLAALREAFGEVTLVAKSDVPLGGLGAEVWPDERPERHPLAGVVTALRRARARVVVVAACDMPFVTAELALELSRAVGSERAAAPIASTVVQPLFAAYAVDAAKPLEAALEQGLPVTEAVSKLNPVLGPCSADVLLNVNTPADLAEAERRLKAG